MIFTLTEMAEAAVRRYGFFLNVLRGQAEMVFRRGARNEALRNEAVSVARGAAGTFLSAEQNLIAEDSLAVAEGAYETAMRDLGISVGELPEHIVDFSEQSSYYISRVIAAQAERDLMTMAQHNQAVAQRIDLYVRSGNHTDQTAAAQMMVEDNQMPAFRFMDRLGRRFKTTKHIRDTYRQHLLNIYNEVYLDTVAGYGRTTVRIDHPNTDYKWYGAELAIVTDRNSADYPLYYDLKEEIFHPSSQASVTIREVQE
jgi:hypothetical protein